MITTINLSLDPNKTTLVSHELEQAISEVLTKKQKVVLYLNKRGNSSVVNCNSCGYTLKCPYSETFLRVHKDTSGKRFFMSHESGYKLPYSHSCPKCKKETLEEVGVRIQQVEETLNSLYPDSTVFRLDSDAKKDKTPIEQRIEEADIIIGTKLVFDYLLLWVGMFAFLLIESDLGKLNFSEEEELFLHANRFQKQGVDIYIQTYTPDTKLIQDIEQKNYKQYLVDTLAERKEKTYPPYGQIADIYIRDKSKTRIQNTAAKLYTKIGQLFPQLSINYQKLVFEREGNDYKQKIHIKGEDLYTPLQQLKKEILSNRSIYIQW